MTSNPLPMDVTVTVEHLPDSDDEDCSSNQLTHDEHTLVIEVKMEKDYSEKSEPGGYDGDDKQSTLIEVSVDPLAIIPENPYEFHDQQESISGHDQQEPIMRRKSKRKRTRRSAPNTEYPDQPSDHCVARDFTCPICLKLLGSKKALKYHITTHRDKPHACNVCNKRFHSVHTCKTRSGETDMLTDKQRRKRELATERMRKFRQRKQMALVAQLAAMTEEMKREMERERQEKEERRRECARERSRKYRENKKLENTQQTNERV